MNKPSNLYISELNLRLCKLFGIDSTNVESFTLVCKSGELPRLTIRRIVFNAPEGSGFEVLEESHRVIREIENKSGT